MIKLALLGLWHEANTFAARPADAAYVAAGVQRGEEIVAQHAGGSSTVAGYLAAAARHPDVAVVPLSVTMLVPAGPLTAEALRQQTDELVAGLSAGGPFDAVLAVLHGAAVAEDEPDVDGYLLGEFRKVVGPRVPIGVSLDLHANLSARMGRYADVLNSYRTNPHVDAAEVAAEVAELVIRAVRGEIRPTVAVEPVPAAINILCQNTDAAPMRDLLAQAGRVRDQPGVLSATVTEGYPYADVPEMGMATAVVTDGDPGVAGRRARWLAEQVWRRRHEFDATAPGPAEALRRAAAAPGGPVLLLDVGDNIGGGSPGDSVVLLHAARRAGFADLVTIVADPASVDRCEQAGVGGRARLEIGARTDPQTGPPVMAEATVLARHDGVYRAQGPVHAGWRHLDSGPTVAVRLDSGQTVILTSKVVMPLAIEALTTLGLAPERFRAIVAKGVHSPLAGYGPHVREVVWVDTPGVTSAALHRFRYTQRCRPMFPFESAATYPPADEGR